MTSATALLERPAKLYRARPTAPTLSSRATPAAEAMLRDMGFVFHLTHAVKRSILGKPFQGRNL